MVKIVYNRLWTNKGTELLKIQEHLIFFYLDIIKSFLD